MKAAGWLHRAFNNPNSSGLKRELVVLGGGSALRGVAQTPTVLNSSCVGRGQESRDSINNQDQGPGPGPLFSANPTHPTFLTASVPRLATMLTTTF